MAKVSSLHSSMNIHVSYKKGEEKKGYFFGGNWVGADWNKDNSILMQFTGLKDKNGVDIYEEDTFNYRNNIFKCTFKGDRFGLEVLNQETCSGGEINKHYSLYLVSNIIEVIGNIHENKY